MFKCIKLMIVSFCFVSTLSFAVEEPKSVIVSGTGGARELALNNAFRHAVEQAVGMMVSSESYVKNLKDIQDKIFVVSDGFIESYDILKEDHDVTGYAVTIAAVVRKKQLQNAVVAATGTEVAIDGAALFANQMLKEDNIGGYKSKIIDLLDDLVQNGFYFEFSQPQITKDDKGFYVIKYPTINIYIKREWLKAATKYKSSITNNDLFWSAIKDIPSLPENADIWYSIGFVFEMTNNNGDVISRVETVPIRGRGFNSNTDVVIQEPGFNIPKILQLTKEAIQAEGVLYHSASRNRVNDVVIFEPLEAETIPNIKKIVGKAVVLKSYGGKLPTYKGNGKFE